MTDTKMSRAVLPGQTNHRGSLFGGIMMQWMDEIAGITAKRYTQTDVTTVAVEDLHFLMPISMGSFVDVIGEVTSVGNTSLKIKVEAWVDGIGKAVEGVFIYVAIDEYGKPKRIERK